MYSEPGITNQLLLTYGIWLLNITCSRCSLCLRERKKKRLALQLTQEGQGHQLVTALCNTWVFFEIDTNYIKIELCQSATLNFEKLTANIH